MLPLGKLRPLSTTMFASTPVSALGNTNLSTLSPVSFQLMLNRLSGSISCARAVFDAVRTASGSSSGSFISA